jgi:GNAT superfamily N-acetyltransferase
MWNDILRIQLEVYVEIEPEDLKTMRSKWLVSPQCCFTYQKYNKTLAYLLAHAWNSETPPNLSEPLNPDCKGNILFLHDLAVSDQIKGMGVGKAMFEHLLSETNSLNFERIMLVAIQGSNQFWQKQGFEPIENDSVKKSYGNSATVMQRWL